jgi:hypothetical protein
MGIASLISHHYSCSVKRFVERAEGGRCWHLENPSAAAYDNRFSCETQANNFVLFGGKALKCVCIAMIDKLQESRTIVLNCSKTCQNATTGKPSDKGKSSGMLNNWGQLFYYGTFANSHEGDFEAGASLLYFRA